MNKSRKITIKLLVFLFVFIGTFFALSSLFLTSQAIAEEDKKANLGLSIGLSIAKQSASVGGISISSSSRNGLALGADFFYDLIEYISLGAGIMYIQKGAEVTFEVIEETLTAETILNYLAIPIPVHFQANIKAGDTLIRPFALFSLEPSFLLSAKSKFKVEETTEEEDITDELEGLDFGIGFGGGIKVLFSGFFLSAKGKYILGLSNISKAEVAVVNNLAFAIEVKNRAFAILLSAGLRF